MGDLLARVPERITPVSPACRASNARRCRGRNPVGLRQGGHRADIYELAKRLVKLGLAE
jgi:hypothetical protein